MRRKLFLLTVTLAIFSLFGLLFATLGDLPTAISSLCGALTNLLPIVGMLMVLVAAVVYATGQMMGAETRARGNVWATAALGGALMAFLITTVSPPVLASLFGSAVTCTGMVSNACRADECRFKDSSTCSASDIATCRTIGMTCVSSLACCPASDICGVASGSLDCCWAGGETCQRIDDHYECVPI